MLRKIANHPELVLDPTESSLEQFVRSRGSTHARPTSCDSSDNNSDAEINLEVTLLERSGKLEVLAKITFLTSALHHAWRDQCHPHNEGEHHTRPFALYVQLHS
jgi:hypothetical protein